MNILLRFGNTNIFSDSSFDIHVFEVKLLKIHTKVNNDSSDIVEPNYFHNESSIR